MDKKEYLEAVSKLRRYEHEYYILEEPSVTDLEYDELLKSIALFEKEHPEEALQDSPTKRVGGSVSGRFKQVVHEVPLQSLDNSYDEEDLLRFEESIRREGEKPTYIVEYKIDGLSVELKYENGKLVEGSTRGDGVVGEDVTNNVKTIKTVPLVLSEPVTISVRAEIYMPKRSFLELNETSEKKFMNARNAASGSLRQKDPKVTSSRNLNLFVFDSLKSERSFETHKEKLDYLKHLGFRVSEGFFYTEVKDFIRDIERFEEVRETLSFDIDGMVIKVNEERIRKNLGVTAKSPRWAIAYKFRTLEALSTLREVEWSVGRTGAITPTAVFDPITISGSTISRATLHNEEYIEELGLRINDKIYIKKAGEVIPKVVRVEEGDRSDTKEIEIPTHCPACSSELVKDELIAGRYCPNSSCPEVFYRSLVHFVSRDAMNIEGLGEKLLKRFIDEGLLKDFSDLYSLKDHRDDLSKKDRLGEKSIGNILERIEDSKSREFSRFLFALGIHEVGKVTARDIADTFRTFEALLFASEEELLKVPGIGKETAHSILDYFKNESNREVIRKLMALGLPKTEEKKEQTLSKTFVITGSFDMPRREIEEWITSRGGRVSSSVSKETDYVLVGEKPGSKKDKAESLGIPLLDLETLYGLEKE
ncbi:NAD-dependent DNA ligase LigA [Guggenheimella bovis]